MSVQDTASSMADSDTPAEQTTATARPRRSSTSSVLWYGLAFALVAALLAFLPLTTVTVKQLFPGEPGNAIQRQIDETMPMPRGLSWSSFTYNTILRLGDLPAVVVLPLLVLLGSLLAYGLLRILNPTFRLTTGVDWDDKLLTKTYMHTVPLIKAFLIAISAALPLFLLWQALAFLLGETAFSLWLRTALVGTAIWFLFSPDGVAGDLDSGNYLLPRNRRVILSLLGRGVLAGTAVWAMIRYAPTVTDETLFRFYHTLGGIGEGQWWKIVALSIGPAAAVGFVGAGLAIALGTPNRSLSQRARLLVPLTLALGLILYFNTVWLPGRLQNRYDFNLSGDNGSAAQLSALTGVPLSPSDTNTILLIAPFQNGRLDQVVPINIAVQSYIGPDAGSESARKIEAFLKKRDYVTALQAPAFFVLHDAASLTWDPVESLKIDFMVLQHVRDPNYLAVFLEKLQVCHATPETRRYVDLLADSRYFVYSDREAQRIVGDIYARYGEKEKAEQWYRKAELPETRVAERLAEKTMYTEGRMTGRLLLDGKPVSGARVGVMPATTQPGFRTGYSPAMRELRGAQLQPGLFRPYWLRWLAASTTTDAEGRFALEHLVAGHFRLLVQIPGVRARSFSNTFSLEGLPDDVFVGFGRPSLDLGTLKLTRHPESAQGDQVSRR